MIACTGSLIAMLLHSLVDFNLFAWICGIVASGIDSRRPRLEVRIEPAAAEAMAAT
jgi:hypothetical protein